MWCRLRARSCHRDVGAGCRSRAAQPGAASAQSPRRGADSSSPLRCAPAVPWASSNTERAVLSSRLQPGEEGAPPAAVSCSQAHRAPSSAAEDAAGLEDDL